ncbi:hypothetical protein KIN20_002061 [Parelaphostrongylus tenuis]|uniref:Abnormal cell migration protein 18-like fibronectin type I domain-containing protein n=1 Tax=Parelaphostrongylus tenuis TaxID=148309 RepID=A0AAD5MG91_PARTN|nr:hypothetical protein KIN20_002061 [Parelaphostrongylus tenuis]
MESVNSGIGSLTTKSEHGVKRECKKEANGSITLKSLPKTSCQDYDGRSRAQGSKWTEGSLQFECIEGGIKKAIACVTPSGKLLAPGEVVPENGKIIECEKDDNDKSTVIDGTGRNHRANCKDHNGQNRTQGSIWVEGPLQYTCDKKGTVLFINCVTPNRMYNILSNGANVIQGKPPMECIQHADGMVSITVLHVHRDFMCGRRHRSKKCQPTPLSRYCLDNDT